MVNKFASVTGGADRLCLDVTTGLRDRGHTVSWLSTRSETNVERTGAFIPATITGTTRHTARGSDAARVATRAVWNTAAAHAMDRLLDAVKPDVVHLHKLYPQLSVAPAVRAAKRGVPVVQTMHDYEFVSANPLDDSGRSVDCDDSALRYRALNTLLFGIKRLVHRHCVTDWIAVSNYVASVGRLSGISSTVIYNFVPHSSPSRDPLSFEGRTGVVFVGRLTPEKGVRDALALAQRLASEPVTIAGFGALWHEAVRAARNLSNVTLPGALSRAAVLQLLRSSRVLVCPSRWAEPANLAALEAMSVGTPIVTYDRGGLAEYVRTAAAGLVVPSDVLCLERATRTLHSDKALWTRCSLAALQASNTLFSSTQALESLERVYGRAIARGHA